MAGIHIFLSNILWTLKYSFFRNRNIFYLVKPYLATGKFRNSLHCDYIYEVSHKRHFDNITFASSSYQHPIAKRVIAFITWIIVYKNRAKENFGGTEIIISSSGQEYKIFNIDRSSVLTLFSDINKMLCVVSNKNHFKDYFYVAQTLEVVREKKFIVEEFISQKIFDKEEAFRCLAKQYAVYARNFPSFKDDDADENCRFFAQRFGKSDLLDLVKEFPMILSHGDLWKSNVMYDGFWYYITDFESVKPRFVLYDLFCFIFTEYVLYDDMTMILYYFQGKYDDLFSDVLLSVNIVFDREKRGLYLLAYLVTVLSERWKTFVAVDCKISKVIKEFIPNYS